jgi:hypothetical protein
MSGWDPIGLITGKSSNVFVNNQPSSWGPGGIGGGQTAASTVGLTGMSPNPGDAIAMAPEISTLVSNFTSKIDDLQTEIDLLAPGPEKTALEALQTQISLTKANLITQANQIWVGSSASGALSTVGPASFGMRYQIVATHIFDSIVILTSVDNLGDTEYEIYGSGITDIVSMTTRGLNVTLGDLESVAVVFEEIGPLYDLNFMSRFGTLAGLIENLINNKIGFSTGVTTALNNAGMPLNEIRESVYEDIVTKALRTITDQDAIDLVIDQYDLTPFGTVHTFADFLDLNIMIDPSVVALLNTDAAGIGNMFNDLGASFETVEEATTMLRAIQIPTVPLLTAATTTLDDLSTLVEPTIKSKITGSGDGVLGAPSFENFLIAVAGGVEVDAILAVPYSNITAGLCTTLDAALVNAAGLFGKASINLSEVPITGLGSSTAFIGAVKRIAVDDKGTDAVTVLNKMIPATISGDAITATMCEAINVAAMEAAGIQPLQYL